MRSDKDYLGSPQHVCTRTLYDTYYYTNKISIQYSNKNNKYSKYKNI